MEEKQPIGIKFSTVLIIIAIIAILAIGGLIYLNAISKNDDENLIETQSNTNTYSRESEKLEENEVQNEIAEENTNEVASNSVASESAEEDEETITTGKYVIKGMELSPDSDETYGIESIDIQKNNKFSINLPLGTSYQGTYTVQEEKIVCIATKQGETEGGEETTENIEEIEFIFEIVNEESLEYIGANSDKTYFELTEGKTYTLENKN